MKKFIFCNKCRRRLSMPTNFSKMNITGRVELKCPCGDIGHNGVKKVKQETKKEENGIVQD